MKVNGIKALDYHVNDNELTIVYTETAMDAIITSATDVISIETEDGDTVQVFAGYTMKNILANVVTGTFTATLTREAPDTTGAAIDALSAHLVEQLTINDEIMTALAELGGIVAGEGAVVNG